MIDIYIYEWQPFEQVDKVAFFHFFLEREKGLLRKRIGKRVDVTPCEASVDTKKIYLS
jgi:hypothetical protein